MRLPWWLNPWREVRRVRASEESVRDAYSAEYRAWAAERQRLREELQGQHLNYIRVNAVRVFRKNFLRELAARLRRMDLSPVEFADLIEKHLDTPTWEIPNSGDTKPELL